MIPLLGIQAVDDSGKTSRRIVALTLAGLTLLACENRPSATQASLSVAGALRSADNRGYARAVLPRTFRFPADHGPHPGFRTEWWYYTGNLETETGRRFGFQLTFFRSALAPPAPEMPVRASRWATREAWLAHFTVTDVAGERFHSFERWSRGAPGLAGAQAEPFRVWLQDWQARAVGPVAFPMRLAAAEGDLGLDLILQQGKPPVLQGDRGLSRKSAEPGNASYYYSLTRMPTAGTVTVDGESFRVSGLAWMDREWSTSSLGANQVGWDWFALQLADDSEIMLYRLRRKDGTADPASQGSLTGADGSPRTLRLSDFTLEDLDRWRSPRSGATYPARWRLRIASEELDVEVRPVLPDQELDVSFRYWEGAVEVYGTRRGAPVRGRGYAELAGYPEASR
jgi:predicted secreted hydrolase